MSDGEQAIPDEVNMADLALKMTLAQAAGDGLELSAAEVSALVEYCVNAEDVCAELANQNKEENKNV